MIYMVPFEAIHYAQMDVQPAQETMRGLITVESLKGLESEFSTTLMEDGKPLACGGAIQYWPNRALVWTFLSNKVNKDNFRVVHAAVKQGIDGLPFNRLEASVDVGFKQGHRWMKLLGFRVEAPFQEAFQVDGSDSVGYVRIKSWQQ